MINFNSLMQEIFYFKEPLELVFIAGPAYITGLIMRGTLFTVQDEKPASSIH